MSSPIQALLDMLINNASPVTDDLSGGNGTDPIHPIKVAPMQVTFRGMGGGGCSGGVTFGPVPGTYKMLTMAKDDKGSQIGIIRFFTADDVMAVDVEAPKSLIAKPDPRLRLS